MESAMYKLIKKIIVKIASVVAGNEKKQIGHLDYVNDKVIW